MQEKINGLRKNIAGIGQVQVAPKIWLGSDEVNLLSIMSEVIEILHALSLQAACHSHAASSLPSNREKFLSSGAQSKILLSALSPIVMFRGGF
ncbi:hypothetical protein KW834_01835 [Pseudomonas sp. PDM29]|uniref:hypothetical protein n=1 Tax=Pseudomonas sp. PDM29 TaxID=2854771 RepID=UPI001C43F1C3|nr:hypothetical protein [Pseudomonas sp. PDM29]MBV7523154.1 hypothetical protein [Pseudomonas sp. PDM29]